jgi:hypothetical protein
MRLNLLDPENSAIFSPGDQLLVSLEALWYMEYLIQEQKN